MTDYIYLEMLGPIWSAYVSITVAAFVDSLLFVGFFINGLALFTVSLYLYSHSQVTIPEVICFALIGAIASDNFGYLVGNIIGDLPLKYWPLKKRQHLFRRGVELIDKYGIFGVFLGRFITLTRPITPFACAVLKMNYKKYLLANIVTCVLWVVFWSIVLKLVSDGVNVLWIKIPKI